MKKLQLSLIVPVYNENENILKTLTAIKKHIRMPHEILIVYDFDKDATLPIVKPVMKKNPHIKLVKNSVVRGPSGAIRAGIAQAQAPYILVTMADLCDDLSQVKQMLTLIEKNADIICPSRYCKGGEQQLKSSLKVWAPRTAGFLLKKLTGIPTYDPTNSYKLYSKRLLDKLTLTSTVSFSVTLEIVVKAHASGYKIVEIPTIWKDRQHGKTNFKLGRSLVYYFPWFLYAIQNNNPVYKKRPAK
jgi:dolichol-phosphate mannosyltransferase